MEEDIVVEETPKGHEGVGQRLRRAREEAGLDLSQVAAETRIPQRHLVTIEEGDLADLPARTYAVGFTRTYARLLGLDEKAILDDVRAELATDTGRTPAAPAKFEPGDPARVPGRGLALFAFLAAVLLLGGIYAFYSSYLAPGLGPAPLQDESEQVAAAQGADKKAQPAAQPTPAQPSGPVVFTSEMDGTWVKFYDANGERIYEAQMDKGQSFTIPDDAEGPQVWTGRPYALAITIGGKSVPKLSEADEVIKDVPVTAEALLARSSSQSAAPEADSTPAT